MTKWFFLCITMFSSSAFADETSMTSTSSQSLQISSPAFEYTAYGYISLGQGEFFKTVQNLEPIVRRSMDLAEFAFEGSFLLTEKSEVEFEVEIEHGGVGSTIEFDPFEEFGEFEQEIEKGGEVVLHEIYYKRKFPDSSTVLKFGKFPLFVSLGSVLTKPHRYPTIQASDLESRMIPLGWTETGIEIEQSLYDQFKVRGAIVNGLNSEFFRTYSWIGGGYQRHFESMNADDLAFIWSLEWGDIQHGRGVVLSRYVGNTTGNRYKVDKLKDSAEVRLLTLMGAYSLGPLGITGQYIEGELDNSDLVAAANATLGGLAKPKSFAPLGKKANQKSLQISYNWEKPGIVFYLKGEHVNTFADTQGNITRNPRYEVNRRSGGLMWIWDQAAFLKIQYSRDKTELPGLPETYQANVALGFDLDSVKNSYQ